MGQHNGRLFLPAWTENSAGPCGTFLIYSKFVTWEDTPLTKCQSYAVTGLLTGYIGARGHAQKLPPSAGSRELHTCDCTAGPILLCHETGNEAFPKQIRQHTGNLTHTGLFRERATSFLLAMQSIFTINNQETMKSMGK